MFQKSFPFLLPPISKQNQLDSPRTGELWCGTCAPSAGLHKALTQSRGWTGTYFPGLSVVCGWNQYFAKWRWVNASSCAGLASVHKWQGRFFIFSWAVKSSSPLHLQTCGCTSTSEWAYTLYIHKCMEAAGLGTRCICIQTLYPAMQGSPQRTFLNICCGYIKTLFQVIKGISSIFATFSSVQEQNKKKPWRGKLPVLWVIQSCTSTYKVPQQYQRIGVMNRNAQLELYPYFMLIIRLEPKLALIDIKSRKNESSGEWVSLTFNDAVNKISCQHLCNSKGFQNSISVWWAIQYA